MERFDIHVRDARQRSGNERYADGQGIPQRTFVSYGNDAQDRLFNLILQQRSSLFISESFISTQAGVPNYALPENIFLSHNIVKVDYTPNGNPQLYRPLDLRSPRQEVSIRGEPDSYFLRGGEIILSPIPSSSYANALRLNWQYTIPTLDIRRANIASVNTGTGVYTLTDNALLLAETESDLTNNWVDYVCVVDRNGLIIDEGKQVVSYNSTTKQLTCTSLVDSLATSAHYLVFGQRASTHSQLPDTAGRYLKEYMTLRAQVGDTSQASSLTSPMLQAIEKEILDAVEMLEEDLVALPVLDSQFMSYADDYE